MLQRKQVPMTHTYLSIVFHDYVIIPGSAMSLPNTNSSEIEIHVKLRPRKCSLVKSNVCQMGIVFVLKRKAQPSQEFQQAVQKANHWCQIPNHSRLDPLFAHAFPCSHYWLASLNAALIIALIIALKKHCLMKYVVHSLTAPRNHPRECRKKATNYGAILKQTS
jgi:hypothetical protein